MPIDAIGLYLHIPFCRRACHYCDFHFSTRLDLREEMVDALIREMELRLGGTCPQLGSIYFGGGTPSLLSEAQLNRIMEAIHHRAKVIPGAEISLEANPEDVNPAAILSWKKAGVNRLSLGLQSVHDERLLWMNRSHSAEEGLRSVAIARDGGLENISADLIFSYPDQGADELSADLEKFLFLQIPHISAYQLTLEPDTVFGRRLKKGQLKPLPEENSSLLFLQVYDTLGARGLPAYEISNFARPGFEAIHNRNYWLQKAFIGIGPSAHGYDGGRMRYANLSSNPAYILQIKNGNLYEEKEEMSRAALLNEFILTRLRMREGLPLAGFREKSGRDFQKFRQEELAKAAAMKWIEIQGDSIILTRAGRLFADYISSQFFIEDEELGFND